MTYYFSTLLLLLKFEDSRSKARAYASIKKNSSQTTPKPTIQSFGTWKKPPHARKVTCAYSRPNLRWEDVEKKKKWTGFLMQMYKREIKYKSRYCDLEILYDF